MKILLEYDKATNQLTDRNGTIVTTGIFDPVGFSPEGGPCTVLELVKQGISPDEIIKLKNNDLL